MKRALAGILTVFTLAGTASAQQPAAGNAERGHALFMSFGCYECHGTAGQGGVGLRLAPGPLPAPVIAAYLRDPSGEMPPYTSAVVSDRDVADIHAYLAGVPAPPSWTALPELRLGDRR